VTLLRGSPIPVTGTGGCLQLIGLLASALLPGSTSFCKLRSSEARLVLCNFGIFFGILWVLMRCLYEYALDSGNQTLSIAPEAGMTYLKSIPPGQL
jgi:hypothetical protein